MSDEQQTAASHDDASDEKLELLPGIQHLSNGIPRGQVFALSALASPVRRDWMTALRRLAETGTQMSVDLEDLPSTHFEILKGRPVEGKFARYALDYSGKLPLVSVGLVPDEEGCPDVNK